MCRSVLRRLDCLSKHVNPRVHAACLKAVLNGWATERRCLQTRDSRCHLGCAVGHGEDSIEHYLGCPIVRHFGCDWLRIPDYVLRCKASIMGLLDIDDQHLRIRVAVLLYATYRLRNSVAHRPPLSPPPLPSALSSLEG